MEELQMLQERGEAMRSLLQRAQGPSGWHLKLEKKSGNLGDMATSPEPVCQLE